MCTLIKSLRCPSEKITPYFFAAMPVHPLPPENSKPIAYTPTEGGEVIHVLLAEDDEIAAETVKRAFRKSNVRNPIYRAKDGKEAFSILRGSDGYERIPRPYMILLDLRMPRMDGLEFLQLLRQDENLKNSVVFVLSTSTAEQDRLAAYDHQIAGYIAKSDIGKDCCNLIQLLDSYWKIVELP